MNKVKTVLCFIVLVLMLISCETSNSLYSWYDYSSNYYKYIKLGDEKAKNEMLATYEKMIEEQKGLRGVIPPGIYSDYGLLLIDSGKTEQGIEMLKMECQIYPESSVFINNILRRFEHE